MENVHMKIDGMHCGGCVANVQRVVAGIEGARADAVRVGAADISFDPELTTAAAITAALSHVGFDARVEPSAA